MAQTVNIQRNPYLVEYESHKKAGRVQAGERSYKSTKSIAGTVKGRETGDRHVKAARGLKTSPINTETARARRAAERRRRKIQRRRRRLLLGCTCVCMLLLSIFLCQRFAGKSTVDNSQSPIASLAEEVLSALNEEKIQGLKSSDYYKHPIWTEDFLTVNEYSRPGDALKEVNSIFVHYTANPGTSAAQNRSYFEQLKDTHERSASAHFIIGYEGEIVQCVPLDEIAYAVAGRNEDSISIECCYTAEDGSFTQETYDSLIELLKWLTDVYNLDEDDILRHYDCGGKKCPIYYTEHEDAWEQLKRDVRNL